MNALCPRCRTTYEVDPERLPAPEIRIRCSSCDEVFPFSAGTPGLPSLKETTPAMPESAVTGEVEVIDARSLTQALFSPEQLEDERTERFGLPRNTLKIAGIVLASVMVGSGGYVWFKAVMSNAREVEPETVAVAPTPTSAPIVVATEPPVEKAPSVAEASPLPTSAPAAVEEKPEVLANLEPVKPIPNDWWGLYRTFSPTSLKSLREKISVELTDRRDRGDKLLMAAEVYSYLGWRSKKKEWITYGHEAAFRWSEAHPGDPRGFRATALAYLAAGQLKKALLPAKNAATLLKDDATAQFVLGTVALESSRTSEAIAVLEPSYGKSPGSFALGEAVARAWLAADQAAKAEQVSHVLVEREPTDRRVGALLADALERQEKWHDLIRLLQGRKDLSDGTSGALRLARAHRKVKNYDAALTVLKEARQGLSGETNREGLADLSLEQGKIYFDRGAFAESLPYFSEARGLRPNDLSTMQFYAGALFREKRYGEAADLYGKALAKSPNDPSLRRYTGMARLEAGDIDGAQAAFRELTLSGNEDASTDYYLARIHEAKGDRQGAISFLERALQKQPDYENARIRLDKLRAQRSKQ